MSSNPSAINELINGMAVIHSNQLENLRDLLMVWLQNHPLAPLENEIVLAQSNGMAQWLKLALAAPEGLGICTAVNMELPGRFLWQTYRKVLGEQIGVESPFSRNALGWHIFKILPELLKQEVFTPIRQFLDNDQDLRKRYALALNLAQLFDQYQVFRADWLQDWAEGLDQLTDSQQQVRPLPATELWQPALWRALRKQLPPEQRDQNRAAIHEQFIQALTQSPIHPNLPRRVVVFGVSALPQQFIEALAALSEYCQVVVCIHNPCRYYWADIIEHKELLRAERKRLKPKPGMPELITEEDLHLHTNPLLAAWGKQGRDYIRLWDQFDDPEHYRDWFQRIDLFDDYGTDPERSLLQQVQQAILELKPLPAIPQAATLIDADDSMVFHVAHTVQREVEILHDQLLDLFANRPDLQPRDIMVMTPDIDKYAPHIRAVFGQIERQDSRYLPFSIADQQERGRNTVLIALESLLHLPDSRFSVTELLDWLETPALRKRFDITEADLPLVQQWLQGAGIRWGLHGEQRETLGLPAALEQNTWQFGLKRLLLGYATGAAGDWREIAPYPEIGGLSSALLGNLVFLLNALEEYWQHLQTPKSASEWGLCLRNLLERFFTATDDKDTLTLTHLLETLETWEELCLSAAVTEPLPLSVVREAWLASIDEANLNQRFMVGSINFCTLLPMRAIPFQVICLLGMNDGDFPRSHPPVDFDLMATPGHYRPGDRSRREDDRYLFLEALLSARAQFYVSWVGRNARDNTQLPASVLVGQLRDYLQAGWISTDGDLLEQLTTEHPLQPFSQDYFKENNPLFTYAYEWRSAHEERVPTAVTGPLPALKTDEPINLQTLTSFLRQPVKHFFNQRLKVYFDAELNSTDNSEPFCLDKLQQYQLADELLNAALHMNALETAEIWAAHTRKHQLEGRVPLASFAAAAQQEYLQAAQSAFNRYETLRKQWPEDSDIIQDLQLKFTLADGQSVLLEDWLSGFSMNENGKLALLKTTPNAIYPDNHPKWRRLISPWLTHLAACALKLKLKTYFIGTDATLAFPTICHKQAYDHLQSIMQAWYDNLSQPLPLACETAFVWLQKSGNDPEQARLAAQGRYEGGFNQAGEIGYDAYLSRAYPRFADLYGEAFVSYAEKLYQPLSKNVTVL